MANNFKVIVEDIKKELGKTRMCEIKYELPYQMRKSKLFKQYIKNNNLQVIKINKETFFSTLI